MSDRAALLEKPLTAESLAGESTETLHELKRDVVGRCEELSKKAETGGGFHALDKDERDAMRSGVDNIKVLGEAIAEREGDEETLAHFREAKALDDKRRKNLRNQRAPIYDAQPDELAQRGVTPGEIFIDDDAYKTWMRRYPDGAPARGGGAVESDAVAIPHMAALLGFHDDTDRLRGRMGMGSRALIVGADEDAAGSLVRPTYLGLLEPGLTRPLTVLDMVTRIPVQTDAIEYVKEESREPNAAIVPEAAQIEDTGDETATKPEGGLTFKLVTDTIKTIAEWVAATKRILSDAPQLRAYIDAYLVYDLQLELEDQIVSGDGTGEDFLGILNAGINVLAAPADDNSVFDQIRKAKTVVRLQGRTNATAVLVHPTDSEYIDLQKVNSEANHFVGQGPYGTGDNSPVWRLPRIETEAMPLGEALVGDFKRAVFFDREQATVSVGTVDKDFIRNIVRILAELRGGFGVPRPAAFARVPLYSGGASSA